MSKIPAPAAACLVVAASLAVGSLLTPTARAGAFELTDKPITLLAETVGEPGQATEKDVAAIEKAPTPPAPEAPNIHGFFNMPFKTAYVTPRGLVVENQGLVVQPVVGLVFPIGDIGFMKDFTFVGGIWNCITNHQNDPEVGDWNEMDYFFSVSTNVAKDVSLALTYQAWYSPTNAFQTERNLDLKVSYNDSAIWGNSGFAINPYVDVFWAMSGDSTVVLGAKGGTGYVELGVAPTYKFFGKSKYPLTVSVPTYFSVGPEEYWGDPDEGGGDPDGNFGVFCTSINVGVPLSFIPTRYGYWHADAGLSYFYLINDTLQQAGEIVSGNDDSNVFVASVGIGVNF
jgi:hypothetical protein